MEAKNDKRGSFGKLYLSFGELFRRLDDESLSEHYFDRAYDVYKTYLEDSVVEAGPMQMQQLYIILGKLHEHKKEYDDAMKLYKKAKLIRGVERKTYTNMADNYIEDVKDIKNGK